MNIIDFMKLVGEIRNNCGLKCFGPNYYIFIHKGLKRATVNNTGYINMSDVAYVLVVCAYNWENMGYVNNSLTQLMMVDGLFNPVDAIPFGEWDFKGLCFVTYPGQWYNAWKPEPKLELRSDTSIENYKPKTLEEWNQSKFPKWEWSGGATRTYEFQTLLDEINEFVKVNAKMK